jgi:hypothetical protein
VIGEKAMFDVAKLLAIATGLLALAVLGGGGWPEVARPTAQPTVARR